MVGELVAGLGAVKAAFDIAKGLKDIDDATRRNAAVIELQEKILTAQAAQSELVETVGTLEKEVADLKAWGAEKENYQLTNVGDGVLAYMLKPAVESAEPPHMLCAHCYQNNKKSFLQPTQELRMRRRVHTCPSCKNEFTFSYVPPPPAPQIHRSGGSHRRV